MTHNQHILDFALRELSPDRYFLLALAAFAVTSVIAIIWVGLGAKMVADDIDSATGAGE